MTSSNCDIQHITSTTINIISAAAAAATFTGYVNQAAHPDTVKSAVKAGRRVAAVRRWWDWEGFLTKEWFER